MSQASSLVVIVGALVCLSATSFAAPSALKVVGNQIQDATGRTVRLRGVNVPSLDWSPVGENVLQSIDVALGPWNANVIRVPLTQDLWFGSYRGTKSADGGEAYRKLVDSVVQKISNKNCYVLLDLHWSNAGTWGKNVGQHKMPDENSIVFWKDFAARYANNPAVLFDLYNEPFGVTWDVWKNGGAVEEDNGKLTYKSPGMQALLNTVRATGAKNVVIAGGLDWGYDLTGIMSGYALSDKTGNGIVYGSHIYPWKKDWDKHVTPVVAKHPVFVGEVGTKPWEEGHPPHENVYTESWAPEVMAYMDRHKLHWTAWSLHPTANPCLITGWDYTPTAYWGRYVKAALATNAKAPVADKTKVKRRLVVWNGDSAKVGAGWVNPTTSTIRASNESPIKGKAALELKFKDSVHWIGAGWNWLAFKTSPTIGTDITGFTHLSFWIKSKGRTGALQLNLLCNGTVLDTPEHHTDKVMVRDYCPNLFDGEWHQVSIPLKDLKQPVGFDAKHVVELQLGFLVDGSADGSFLFDEIGFEVRA